MNRVGEAFVWPFRDPEWVGKIVIIGLISLIPLIGGINALGWMLAAVHRLRAGEQVLPEADFRHLGRGFQLFVVLLVYAVALLVIAALFFVPSLILLTTQNDERGNTPLALLGVLLQLVAFGITTIGFLLFYLVRPAIVLATDERGIGGGLNVASVLRRVRASPIDALIAGLMLIAAGFVGGLGVYACFIGVIFTLPYSLATEAWIYRSYEIGSREEGLNVREPTASPER